MAAFDWDELDLDQVDLQDIEGEFTLEEVRAAVLDTPADKAPGPDEFSGGFFRSCWEIIKIDLLAALNQLYHMDSTGLARINKSLIVLLPKKRGADRLQDFWPISLVHSLIKIFTKILARRLAPKLRQLVDPCQAAFIKHRSI